jgi:hypothetical protein
MTAPTSSAASVSNGRRWLFRGSLALLIGWLLFLLYLVLTTANPVIVSRPQVLTAGIIIVGRIEQPPELQVEEVLLGDPQLIGKTLQIADFKPSVSVKQNERYILPLEHLGDHYRIHLVPLEAGVDPAKRDGRIYRDTPEARRQVDELVAFRRKMEAIP